MGVNEGSMVINEEIDHEGKVQYQMVKNTQPMLLTLDQ